jgi:hypothetical protein
VAIISERGGLKKCFRCKTVQAVPPVRRGNFDTVGRYELGLVNAFGGDFFFESGCFLIPVECLMAMPSLEIGDVVVCTFDGMATPDDRSRVP